MDVSPEVLATVQRHLRHVVERIDDTFYARARSQATAAIRDLPQVDFILFGGIGQPPVWNAEVSGPMPLTVAALVNGLPETTDDSQVTLSASLNDGTVIGVEMLDASGALVPATPTLVEGRWRGKIMLVGVPSSHVVAPPFVSIRVDCADGRVGTGYSVQWIAP